MKRKTIAIGPRPDMAAALRAPLPPARASIDDRVAAAGRHGWRSLPADARPGEILLPGGGTCLLVSADSTLVLPPGTALAMPAKGGGALLAGGISATVLRAPAAEEEGGAAPLPGDARPVLAGDLMRGLVQALAEVPEDAARHAATRLLLRDELARAPAAGFALVEPGDPRLGRVTRRLWMQPEDPLDIDAAAALAVMSRRTFTRRFGAETGMGFDAWQRRLRLLTVVPRLEDGASVSRAANDLGYDSVSAFIAAFRRAFGATPRRFGRSAAASLGSGRVLVE